MLLARILSKIYKEDGIILIDAKGQKYICGNPSQQKPIILKLLKENLKWKLVIDPEIEFPEAYMRNEITIENASLKEFLMQLIKNLGREELSSASFLSKKIYGAWRYITNFNLPGKSKTNVQHHYDIGGEKGEKLFEELFKGEIQKTSNKSIFRVSDKIFDKETVNNTLKDLKSYAEKLENKNIEIVLRNIAANKI